VEPFSQRLETHISSLDEELAMAVRAQSQIAGKALDDLDVARRAVGELHSKVKNIRSKAEDSEARVEAVCHDITRLDRAKTNLIATMNALKRASMFLTGVDQLEFLTQSRQYLDAAQALHAVSDLSKHFEGWVLQCLREAADVAARGGGAQL
jgi:chromosome segregation ATPase